MKNLLFFIIKTTFKGIKNKIILLSILVLIGVLSFLVASLSQIESDNTPKLPSRMFQSGTYGASIIMVFATAIMASIYSIGLFSKWDDSGLSILMASKPINSWKVALLKFAFLYTWLTILSAVMAFEVTLPLQLLLGDKGFEYTKVATSLFIGGLITSALFSSASILISTKMKPNQSVAVLLGTLSSFFVFGFIIQTLSGMTTGFLNTNSQYKVINKDGEAESANYISEDYDATTYNSYNYDQTQIIDVFSHFNILSSLTLPDDYANVNTTLDIKPTKDILKINPNLALYATGSAKNLLKYQKQEYFYKSSKEFSGFTDAQFEKLAKLVRDDLSTDAQFDAMYDFHNKNKFVGIAYDYIKKNHIAASTDAAALLKGFNESKYAQSMKIKMDAFPLKYYANPRGYNEITSQDKLSGDCEYGVYNPFYEQAKTEQDIFTAATSSDVNVDLIGDGKWYSQGISWNKGLNNYSLCVSSMYRDWKDANQVVAPNTGSKFTKLFNDLEKSGFPEFEKMNFEELIDYTFMLWAKDNQTKSSNLFFTTTAEDKKIEGENGLLFHLEPTQSNKLGAVIQYHQHPNSKKYYVIFWTLLTLLTTGLVITREFTRDVR